MSELLPTRPSVDYDTAESRIVTLDESGHEVITALQSETAREVMTFLYEEPMTPSDLATRLDTSVQNVSYHLANLREADLVTVIDSWYSEKGREMDVYAPTTESLILTVSESRIS